VVQHLRVRLGMGSKVLPTKSSGDMAHGTSLKRQISFSALTGLMGAVSAYFDHRAIWAERDFALNFCSPLLLGSNVSCPYLYFGSSRPRMAGNRLLARTRPAFRRGGLTRFVSPVALAGCAEPSLPSAVRHAGTLLWR